jgi:hypothetical protein
VQVRVVEARDHRALVQVDDAGGVAKQGHGFGVAANRDEAPVLDGYGTGLRVLAVNRMQATVVQDEIGTHDAS